MGKARRALYLADIKSIPLLVLMAIPDFSFFKGWQVFSLIAAPTYIRSANSSQMLGRALDYTTSCLFYDAVLRKWREERALCGVRRFELQAKMSPVNVERKQFEKEHLTS